MAKDPAFLFYYQDFIVGTRRMSYEAKGIYIDLLCEQADKGFILKEHMQSICKAYPEHNFIIEKFTVDEQGNFYNERLRAEQLKRSKYITSRKENAKAYAKHMENENENIKERKKEDTKNITNKIFIKPSITDISIYCKEKNLFIDAERFINHYESNGWKVGKVKMVDWRAAVRNWARNDKPAENRSKIDHRKTKAYLDTLK